MIKSLKVLFSCVCFLFCSSLYAQSLADPSFSFSAAYDAGFLYYVETTLNDKAADSDSGWMRGASLEGRYDNKQFFLDLFMSCASSDSATYQGSVSSSNGTTTTVSPISFTTKEQFRLFRSDIGGKAYNDGRISIAPLCGLGYRFWRRGRDNASIGEYAEDYSWFFFHGGAEVSMRSNDLLLRIRGTLHRPFRMKMTTDIYGQADMSTFKIKPKTGGTLEVTADYTVHRDDSFAVSLFISPYYQRWNIRESDPMTLYKNGKPVMKGVYEPDSSTDYFGCRLGASVTL